MHDRLYNKLVKNRPYLWWWVKDKENLSVESIVEGVLSYGDMEDVVKLFELLGRNEVKKIFENKIQKTRHNYRPQTVNLFKKVFDKRV
jgi:hypothetical protein